MAHASVARGLFFAGLGGVCWGFSGACAQLLTDTYDISIPWLICVRLLFGSVFFLTLAALKSPGRLRKVPKEPKLLGILVLYAVLGVLGPQVFYLTTISFTNAGIATVMERMGLILILAITCFKFRRVPKVREVLGVILALVGVFLIATEGNVGHLAISPEGLICGCILAVTMVFYTVLPVHLLAEWGNFVTTGLGMLIAGILAWVVVQPWTIAVDLTPEVIFYVALMVIAGTFCSYGFFMQGVKEAGSMKAGLMGCTEPVAATAFAAIWLGTTFAPPVLVGIVLIIVMIFLVQGSEE
ncbi:MAG: DMT family transporter [Eggerthellales bacterium]|nr:DMT family transporter [Eggerthellales bacterium]